MATKKTTQTVPAQDAEIEAPIGQWAARLAEANLIQPYTVTASITIAVPDPDRAQAIRDADMALSLLRFKLAELLQDKSREPAEATELNAIRDKLDANPGTLTPPELSLLTVAIMNRRSGVPEDLFDQVAKLAREANDRLRRALLGDQYDAVTAYLKPQNYDVQDLLIDDIKKTLLPMAKLPQAPGKDGESSPTSTGTGPPSKATSSTEE